MPAHASPALAQRAIDFAADPLASQRTIAASLAISQAGAASLIARYEPVAHELRAIRRDLFTGIWQYAALENVHAMYEHQARGGLTAGDRRNYMVAAAVASEKALLFAGQPTQIVAGLHEVRVELPALLDKLAQVGARIQTVSGEIERVPLPRHTTGEADETC